MKTFEKLNKNEMKMILGGDDREISFDDGGGSGCSLDNNGLCGANCSTSTGAAAKCSTIALVSVAVVVFKIILMYH